MALQAILEIEGKKFSVLDLDYKLSKPVDGKGKVTGATQPSAINFTIQATEADQFLFHEWIKELETVKSGTFKLPITDGIIHYQTTVEFKKAYCTELSVHYSNTNDKQMYMRVSISPTEYVFGSRVDIVNIHLEKA